MMSQHSLMLFWIQLPLLLLTFPLLLLCLQLLAALPRTHERPPPATRRPPIAVVVPAHNEAAGIGATLASIQRQLRPGDLLLVVADNCDDDTATISRRAGAQVVERYSTSERGKAYALACGLRQLAAAPLPVIIFVDADCLLQDRALDWLSRRVVEWHRPVQALYLMHARDGASALRRVAEFAWRVKNGLRAVGRARLGMACQLTGSGMAFPWDALQAVTLDEHSLIEDVALGLSLAAAGKAPAFCPEAVVHSSFADNTEGARTQRTRWEHGQLHLLWRHAVPHLLAAMWRRDWRYLSLAMDLFIAPLSILLMGTALAGSAPLIAWAVTGNVWPWLMLLIAPCLLACVLIAVWFRDGRDLLPARRLPAVVASIIVYMAGKVPLYLRFFAGRQRDWIGAARDTPKHPP
jgi:cellulose synthase/poly-beta-1,6-N-acetylglucosamine synthase-like glycosyltransferase